MDFLLTGLLLVLVLISLGGGIGIVGLEIANSRQKNMLNVSMKAMTGFASLIFSYVLFGYSLGQGHDWQALIRHMEFPLPDLDNPYIALKIIVQLPLMLLTSGIIACACAERIRYQQWTLIMMVMGGLIWPVITHLMWSGLASNPDIPSMNMFGLVDEGKIGAILFTGGCLGLSLLVVVGPRRVDAQLSHDDNAMTYTDNVNMGFRYPGMAVVSIFAVGVGLMAMVVANDLASVMANPVQSVGSDRNIALIMLVSVINVFIGATIGIISAMMIRQMFFNNISLLQVLMGGLFGGIVAVSFGLVHYRIQDVAIVGGVAGILSCLGQGMFIRLKIDDASGLIAPSILSGAWGMLVTALFAPKGVFPGNVDGAHQFVFQLQALIAISGSSLGFGVILFRMIEWATGLRVSAQEERLGINLSDSGVDVPTMGLIEQMVAQQVRNDYSDPVRVDQESDVAVIAQIYNNVLEKLHIETVRRQIATLRLAQVANYDSLTGLANRRLFHDLIHRAMGRSHRSGRNGALLVLDIDAFKRINDRYGHSVGDQVLMQISQRIADSIRETDALARTGGDQFALLLEDLSSPETPRIVAAKIVDAVTRPVQIAGNAERLTMSIGIAVFGPGQVDSVETILRKAETALDQAKTSGRGVMRYYDPLKDVMQDGNLFGR